MRPFLLCCLAAGLTAADLPAPYTPADFPCWRGPMSCGAALDNGKSFVANLKAAKKVWTNDEQLPTDGWTNRKQKGLSGGYSNPVVCDGRVFFYTYVPAGPEDAEYVKQYGDKYPGKFRVAADELYLCVDAKTGKTIWKKVFAGEGINFNHSAQGPLAVPFATRNRFYAFGTAGWLRCFDAKSGEQLWKTSLGPAADDLRQRFAACLAEKKIFNQYSQATAWGHCPTVADGVVVCVDNDFRKLKESCGLVGIDAENGKLLWGPLAKAGGYTSSPLRTTVDGKEYVLSLSMHRLMLLEPKTGKPVWEVNDHEWVPQSGSMAIGDGHVVFHARKGGRAKGAPHGWLRCYRFDAEGAEKAWELPAGRERGKQAYSWGSCVIYRGAAWGCFNTDEHKGGNWGAVDLKTGEVLLDLGFNSHGLHAAGGHIFSYTRYVARKTAAGWEKIEKSASAAPSMEYSVPVIAGGRMYSWGGDGHLHCYDLTR